MDRNELTTWFVRKLNNINYLFESFFRQNIPHDSNLDYITHGGWFETLGDFSSLNDLRYIGQIISYLMKKKSRSNEVWIPTTRPAKLFDLFPLILVRVCFCQRWTLHDQVPFIRLLQVIKINILLRIKLILYYMYLQNSFLSDRLWKSFSTFIVPFIAIQITTSHLNKST